MAGYFISHWQGRISASLSLFGTLIGLRAAIHLLYGTIPTPLSYGVIALIFLTDCAVLVWQITGTIRANEHSLNDTGSAPLYWPSYLAALVATVYVVSDAATLVSNSTRIILPEPEPPLELAVQDNTVLIKGEIGFDTHTALLSLLEKPGQPLKTLRLSSDGGRIFAARAIALTVIAHDMDTEVIGRCASACTLIFLAGKRRILLHGAELGFHQYALNSNVQLLDTKAEQEKDRQYFLSRGVSQGFIDRMFQSGHQGIWFPGRAELKAAGIITD